MTPGAEPAPYTGAAMSDLSELLTVPEAAKVAGVSDRTMRR